MDSLKSFRQFCRNATDAQLDAIIEKERKAGRRACELAARAVRDLRRERERREGRDYPDISEPC